MSDSSIPEPALQRKALRATRAAPPPARAGAPPFVPPQDSTRQTEPGPALAQKTRDMPPQMPADEQDRRLWPKQAASEEVLWMPLSVLRFISRGASEVTLFMCR